MKDRLCFVQGRWYAKVLQSLAAAYEDIIIALLAARPCFSRGRTYGPQGSAKGVLSDSVP